MNGRALGGCVHSTDFVFAVLCARADCYGLFCAVCMCIHHIVKNVPLVYILPASFVLPPLFVPSPICFAIYEQRAQNVTTTTFLRFSLHLFPPPLFFCG